MTQDPLETPFRAWTERRDLAALAEVFDQVAPALLRLARHLVPDGSEPEDLVQATFLAVLESPEGWDGSRAVAPWLAGILGRRAAQARRRASAGVDQRRLPPTASTDPLDEVADREVAQLVRGAIDRVPQPYQAVLAGRLAGRGAAEVADALGRKPTTVHVQTHRGLRLLRRVLPVGFAANAFGESRGLARVRSEVLRAARAGGPRTRFAAPMGTALVVGFLGAIAATLIGIWTWSDVARPEIAGVDAEAPNDRVAGSPGRAPLVDAGGERAERGRVDPGAGAALTPEGAAGHVEDTVDDPNLIQWWVVGQVLAPPNVEHGKFAYRGTKVRVQGPGVGMEFGVVRTDGGFRQPMLSTPPWEMADEAALDDAKRQMVFTVSHPEFLPGDRIVRFEDRFGDTVSVEVELRAAGRLQGAATDQAGADLPACYVQVYPLVGGELKAPAIADRGFVRPSSYDLLAEPGDSIAVVGLGGLRPAGSRAMVTAGETQTLPTVLLEAGGALFGTMTPPPESGTLVEARLVDAPPGAPLGPLEVTWHGGRVEWSLVKATVGADGSFSFTGLAPGERYRVRAGGREVVAREGAGPIDL